MTHAVKQTKFGWKAIDESTMGDGTDYHGPLRSVFFMSWDRFEKALSANRPETPELKVHERIEKIRSTSEGLYVYVVDKRI